MVSAVNQQLQAGKTNLDHSFRYPIPRVGMMVLLSSFAPDMRAVVVGARGGIGSALVRALKSEPNVDAVFATSRRAPAKANDDGPTHLVMDPLDERDVADTAERIGPVDLVIVATGMLHGHGISPEKSWRHLDPEGIATVLQTNTIAPSIVAKHFLPRLTRGRKAVFAALSARIGSIGDNGLGGWHAYRASKAALNMMLRCFAIELARQNETAICIGLHPGTVATELSAPFQSGVPDGKLFSPDQSAAYLLQVINNAVPQQSGAVLAWDGTVIPP